jgi:hypothetical protein
LPGKFGRVMLTVVPEEGVRLPMGDTTKKGRDSRTGQFIPVKDARQRPNTTTVERVPKPGYGDTKNEPSRKK